MKVTDVELVYASKYLFVKVHTDEGIIGLGEVGAWGYIDAVAGALEKLRHYIIGKDPRLIEHHWNYMYRSLYFRGAIVMSAIAAIDIALWDILGKKLGVPVYSLLGGKTRDKVRTYAPVFEFTAEAMAEACIKLKKEGFTAARLMIMPRMDQEIADGKDDIFSYKIKDYIERVRACRVAVGDEFDLILEVHRSMTPPEAIAFAKGVEEYHPLFLEDPIPPDSVEVMADVASHISIPIATGERAISLQEMGSLIKNGALKYVRPDVCAIGGLTPSKKIAALAEAYYVSIVPHNPLGPVSTAACLQLNACVPNFLIQEFPSFYHFGSEDQMLKQSFKVKDGYIYIPDAPGIGIELIDGIEEKFPFNQRDLTVQIGFDGSIKDR
nr:galactonate dehydratase [Lysinibacillus timonensis]